METMEDRVHELGRDCDRPWMAEMVVIPQALAIDLVHYLAGVGCIIHEMTDEQCESGEHETFEEKHIAKMEALEMAVNDRLCTMGIAPTAINMLNALSMAYECSPSLTVN
jgi:hypothetical protein